jgi:hypothetical protein
MDIMFGVKRLLPTKKKNVHSSWSTPPLEFTNFPTEFLGYFLVIIHSVGKLEDSSSAAHFTNYYLKSKLLRLLYTCVSGLYAIFVL